MTVAQGNGPGFIEQQNVHVTGGFDGSPGRGDHVGLHHAAHARHTDGGQQVSANFPATMEATPK